MGVEPFLLASTVTAIAAQRLVRRLCPDCKAPYTPSQRELDELGITKKPREPFYKPVGCESCRSIGYRGRLGLYEIAEVDDHLRAMIHDNASEAQMSAYVFRARQTLLQSGAAHVMNGLTSAEDVLRVCHAESEGERG
jgi:general secretion pathway protein E